MNFRKTLNVLTLSIGLGAAATLQAQTPQPQMQMQQQAPSNFSEEDYQQFIALNLEIMPIQQEAQGSMMEAISASGLEMQRFQELAQAQQQGTIEEAGKSAEEIAKFNKAGEKVMTLQQQMQQEIQASINESDMGMQKFQQMSMAYQQDEEVRSKIDSMMQEKMEKS